MGCYTVYVLRRHDGLCRVRDERWGQVHFDAPRDLLRHIGQPTTEIEAAEMMGCCRGWYVDPKRRIARQYLCSASEGPRKVFLADQRLRGDPAWADWDAAVAFGGRSDVFAMAGRGSKGRGLHLLDRWGGCEEMGLVTNDPARFPHRWLDGVLTYPWFFHEGVDLTVIDADHEVRDYSFDGAAAPHDVVLGALGLGPGLLEVLAATVPSPAAGGPAGGVVVDVPQGTVRVWLSGPPVGDEQLAAAADRWPGWTVERERAGRVGHLQRTGRSEQAARDVGWGDGALPYAEGDRGFGFLRCVNADV